MRLKNRVAIITGGASGIGGATALRFSEEGATVVLADIQEDKLENLSKQIRKKGGEVLFQKVDVRKKEDINNLVERVIKDLGKVDILINNAGINIAVTVKKMREEEFNSLIDVNLKGTFLFCQAVFSAMSKRMYGRIINTASLWTEGHIGQSGYSASKAGVIALTKTLALEYAKYNITVNCISPGTVETPMISNVTPKMREEFLKSIPLKRFAKPVEIANVHLFLASEEASYITGAVIPVDGGASVGR